MSSTTSASSTAHSHQACAHPRPNSFAQFWQNLNIINAGVQSSNASAEESASSTFQQKLRGPAQTSHR